MKIAKFLLFIIIMLLSGFRGVVFSQNKTQSDTESNENIVNILNEFLTYQSQEETENTFGEIVTIEKPYSISKNNILEVVTKVTHKGEKNYNIVTKKVALTDITDILKDINVIFSTRENAVEYKVAEYDEKRKKIKEKTYKSSSFFTDIHSAANSGFRNSILVAFKNAGFPITSEYWYD